MIEGIAREKTKGDDRNQALYCAETLEATIEKDNVEQNDGNTPPWIRRKTLWQ